MKNTPVKLTSSLKLLCAGALLGLTFILNLPAYADSDSPGSALSIYAMRYGADSLFSSREILAQTHHNKVPFTWLVYFVRMGDQKILIDTGFENKDYQKRYGIKRLYELSGLLRILGESPQSITDVILTHAHVDHAGNMGLFPNARFFIQQEEYNYIKNNPWLARQLKNIDPQNITLFEHEAHLPPHITIKHVGGHTRGSCTIELAGAHQHFLFSGDNCYLRKNCQYSPYDGIILTHHDPAILKEAKKINSNVFLIYKE